MNYAEELKLLGAHLQGGLRPSRADWERVEREVNLRVPDDYKIVVSHFGAGRFGANIALRNPLHPDPMFRFSKETLRSWDNVINYWPKEEQQLFYPNAGGLLFMGIVGDGAGLYYRVDYASRVLGGAYVYDGEMGDLLSIPPISEFIWRLYTGNCAKEKWSEFRPPCWGNEQPLFMAQK